ncbi:MAG: hypothetical protein NTX86_00375, partial [Candidatus Dependentiae bacterium]|nr:hypothetical protein [Candidatus Dependentiae bacterium]
KVKENLIQTQKAFNELKQQGILDNDDHEMVQAVERAVSERGAPIHKNYNQLTSEAKKLLADCGVAPENFEGMVGNALQVHLFDRTNDVINELAKMDPKYLSNDQTHEYLQAALDSCADTVYTIKNGTPQEAVAMAKLADTFHQCLRVSYGITKGIGYGLKNVVQDTIERGVLPQQVMIAKNLAQTFQLIAALSQTEDIGAAIGKAYSEFQKLPLEQQAEHITTIVATFLIPVPSKISSGIASANKTLTNIAKIAKREAAGIQLLCKVEGATLKPGQILSGVHATQAPFMAGCQSAIKTVAKGTKASRLIGRAEEKITAEIRQSLRFLPEKGEIINGRFYTKHALERMAPNTPEIIAQLQKRAINEGFMPGTKEFIEYVQPRNIPPSVIEDAIKTINPIIGTGKHIGTLEYIKESVKIVTNLKGDVVTIHKISGK